MTFEGNDNVILAALADRRKEQVKNSVKTSYLEAIAFLVDRIPGLTINQATIDIFDQNDNWPMGIEQFYSRNNYNSYHLLIYKGIDLTLEVGLNYIAVTFPVIESRLYKLDNWTIRQWNRYRQPTTAPTKLTWEDACYAADRVPTLDEFIYRSGRTFEHWMFQTTKYSKIVWMIGSNDTNIAELFVKKYNKYTITLSKAKTSVLDSQKSCYNKYLKLRVKPALAEYKTAKANATTST